MKRRVLSILLALSVITTSCSVLAACGNKDEQSNAESDLKPVKLTWYFPGSNQKDMKLVNDKINEILKEKINATVDLKLLDWSAYDQKMNMAISTREEFDLCWTSPQNNDYYANVARDAFVPLDDLLNNYGKEMRAAIDEKFWDTTRVKGKIYGAINYQTMAAGYGFRVQRPIANASGIDYSTIESYEQLEPLLKYIKENEPDKIPLGYNKTQDPFTSSLPLHGFDAVGSNKTPGVVRLDDTEMKVVNQYDTPEFVKLMHTMRDWYQKGYLKADAATSEENNADMAAGKIAVIFPTMLLGDSTESDLTPDDPYSNTGVPYYTKKFTDTYISTDRVLATLTAISSTSENPERAMMMLELFNTDVELYNLICWGIEGKHYNKTDYMKSNGTHVTIEPIENSGYAPATDWMFGNTKNVWLSSNHGPVEEWEPYNVNGKATPTLGFSFDADSVASEIATCSAVIDEYLNSLVSGSVEQEERYQEFLSKLEVAGADKIIAEKQRQLDEWKTYKQ